MSSVFLQHTESSSSEDSDSSSTIEDFLSDSHLHGKELTLDPYRWKWLIHHSWILRYSILIISVIILLCTCRDDPKGAEISEDHNTSPNSSIDSYEVFRQEERSRFWKNIIRILLLLRTCLVYVTYALQHQMTLIPFVANMKLNWETDARTRGLLVLRGWRKCRTYLKR